MSYAIAVAETERFAGGKPEEHVTMNPAEREQRREALANRISGFSVTGASDPSHRLIDKLATILTKGEVRYISWDKCSERGQELVDIPEVKALRVGKDGFLSATADFDSMSRATSCLTLRSAGGPSQAISLAFSRTKPCTHGTRPSRRST